MERFSPDLSTLVPAGGKRSSKRDRIASIFLRQQGHLSADDLSDLVRRSDPGIGRATVYRTLQWMVGAGIARKVDFGEGRSRFEPSYGHPRHFHLICTTCHRSSEFLSSDVESLMEEIATARNCRLFPPDEPKALAAAVTWILEHPAEAARLAAQARDDVRKRTWENRARAILAFAETL